MKKRAPQYAAPDFAAIRYCLIWALVIASLAYGVHRYFEYRNAELDKRIKHLNK